ncbi:MAG: hypothetical protein PHC34_02390 [Candidatus Gastranaerophilales bacterium]|nr:hypothetical protein [Candidatus Gastranaerophilales bacterium]
MINHTTRCGAYSQVQQSTDNNHISFKSRMDNKLLDLAKKIKEPIIVEYDPNLTDLARCSIRTINQQKFIIKTKNLYESFNKLLNILNLKEDNKIMQIPVIGKFIKMVSKIMIPNNLENDALKLVSEMQSSVRIKYASDNTRLVQVSLPEFKLIGNVHAKNNAAVIESAEKLEIPTGIGNSFNSALEDMAKTLKSGDILLDLTRIGKKLYEVLQLCNGTFIKQRSIIEFSPKSQEAIKAAFEPAYGEKTFLEPGASLRSDRLYKII